MPRFFIKSDEIGKDNTICLSGEDAVHISRSLRMKVGEELTVCDSESDEYSCRIASITKETVTLTVESVKKSGSEPSVQVTVYQALPKGDKLEWIIQKSVELGAAAVVPVLTSRCISRPDEKALEKKQKRWNSIAAEAAKQSGRGILPAVKEMLTFPQAVEAMCGADVSFFCYENETELDLKSFLETRCREQLSTLAFFVGPEGGISPEEAEYALSRGVQPVSLGRRILRTETAPLCVLSGVMLYTDNLK